MANEYDDLLKQSNDYDAQLAIDQDQQRVHLRAAMFAAQRQNPDQYAQARQLEKTTGIPAPVAARNLEEVQQRAKLNEYDALLTDSPVLAARLQDRDFASLAHDDTENLSFVEKVANSFKRGVKGLQQTGSATALGANARGLQSIAGVEQRLAKGEDPASIPDAEDVFGVRWMSPAQREDLKAQFSGLGSRQAQNIAGLESEKRAIPQDPVVAAAMQADSFGEFWQAFKQKPLEFVALVGAESLPNSAPGLIAAVPAGIAAGPVGVAGAMGASSYAVDYAASVMEAMQAEGVDITQPEAIEAAVKDKALMDRIGRRAFAHASVVGAMDALSGGVAGKSLAPARLAGTKAGQVANMAAQAPLQGVMGAAGEAGGSVAAGQDVNAGAVMSEFFGEFATAPLEVTAASARYLVKRHSEVQAAQQDVAALQQLNELATASKLRERDPQSFAAFVEAAAADGPVQDVYVDAQTLVATLNQSGIDPVQVLSPEVQAQIAEGGDVRIPVGEYASTLAATDAAGPLLQHLRMSPEAMSMAEAQTYMQSQAQEFQAEAEKLLAEHEFRDGMRESAANVERELFTQMQQAGRFNDDVNSAYARLMGSFYTVQAARLGITPEEMYVRYPLQIRAEGLPGVGQQFDQGDSLADVLQQWKDAGIKGAAHENNSIITLSQIVVPESERGAGKGTAAIQALIEYADRTGQHIALSPSSDFGGNKKRLVSFYRRFGFVENKGKNRAFTTSESMYRPAPGKVLHQPSRNPDNPLSYNQDQGGSNNGQGNQSGTPAGSGLRSDEKPFRTVGGGSPAQGWASATRASRAGSPATLYRGASLDLTADHFKPESLGKASGNPSSGLGVWFTPRKAEAATYGTVTGYHLDIRNPKIIKVEDLPAFDTVEQAHAFREELRAQGYDGIAITANHLGGTTHLVVFDAPQVIYPQENSLEQSQGGGARGNITFANDIKSAPTIITLLENADLSTFLHESGHFYLEVLNDIANQPDAPAEVVEDMNKLLAWFGITGSEDVQGGDKTGTLEQPAFHGSPYKFDKFTLDKIGSGEGAQAYGYGLYFAGNKEVAEYYRKTTSTIRLTGVNGKKYGDSQEGAESTARGLLWSFHNDRKTFDAYDDGGQSYMGKIARDIKKGIIKEAQGQLYEVEIPDDHEYLLWDKPLTEQSEQVREAIAPLVDEMVANSMHGEDYLQNGAWMRTREVPGQNLYGYLGRTLGSDKAASELLHSLGIAGIKYLDGNSRDGEGDSYNYVVFDANAIEILKTYYQSDDTGAPSGDLPPGRTPLEVWNSMSLEQKRPYHEQLARGFESYLFEGKAPNVELNGLFARFRAWLINVYKQVAALNVSLTDEVRGVFDRMIATNEQILAAEAARSYVPLFETKPDSMSDAEWQEYQRLGTDATQEAVDQLQRRSLRDMQWLTNAKGRVLKALQRDAKAKRQAVEAEVRTEVEAMPINRARRFITRGETRDPETGDTIKTDTGHRINTDALTELYPESMLARPNLAKLRGMTSPEGLHPDMLAEMFGFASGDQLIRELTTAEPMATTIEGMTDQRMLERYGDLYSPDALDRAANEAIHNDARLKFIATGYKAAANAVGPVRAIVAAAKEAAAKMIGTKRVRDVKPAQYAAAEGRAAKAALKSMKDPAQLATHVRNQMLNHALAKEAYAAQDEIEKVRAFFRKVISGTDEQVLKTRDLDIVNAARAILADYGFGMKAKNAAEYLKAVEANDPGLYAVLRDRVQQATMDAKPFDQMTVNEMRDLNDEIASLWHLARRSRQMEIDGDLMDRADIEQELRQRMEEIGIPDKVPGEDHAVTESERRLAMLQTAKAALRRVESWVGVKDGEAAIGPFRKYIWQPVKEAADRYRADRAKYVKRYRELLDAVAPSLKPARIAAPELNGYTFGYSRGGSGKAEILHALLHTGNESNKRKLLLGRKWATENPDGTLDASRWDAFIDRMIKEGRITKADYDFVQGVWDLLEEMKPLAQKTHRDVFGRYFDEVTADSFATPFGAYRGGYVPAIADPEVVADAKTRALAEEENQTLAFAFPATNRGFTKSRVEYNRPLLLDLRSLSQHIDKVLLFSHLEQPIRDVRRVLTAKSVAYGLNRIDPSAFDGLLTPWLNRTARQQVETPIPGTNGLMKFFSALRRNAGMAAMFANVINAAQQITGFSIAAVKVPPKYMLSAAVDYAKSPRDMARAVAEASPFMATRMENEVGQMTDAINEILLNPSVYEQARNWTHKHAYFLQAAVDNVISPVIWTAAYNHALEQGHGEKDAVRLADSVVRETQGSTLPEDVARIETGNAFVRMFTQFAGYFNMQANLLGTEYVKIMQGMGLRKGMGRGLYVLLFGFLVPAWTSELIVQAFRGGPDDEDKDGETVDDWLMAIFGMATLRTATAMVPGIGQGVNAMVNSFNGKPYDDRISTAPAISMIESAVKAPVSVYNAVFEDGKPSRGIRDLATLISMTAGIPANAIARPGGYLADVASDRVEPTSELDTARGIVTGTASPDSRR